MLMGSFRKYISTIFLFLLTFFSGFSQDWSQYGQDIDGEAVGDESGKSVAISANGRIVAIGSHKNNANGVDDGQVRVYQNKSSELTSLWVQMGQDIEGGSSNDQSGYTVSLSDDGYTLAVSHINLSPAIVKVYRFSDGSWNKIGGDIGGVTNDSQLFGVSTSLSSDGNTIAIGNSKGSINGSWTGYTQVYEYASSTWTQIGSTLVGEAPSDESGWSVSLNQDGKYVAIGAPQNDENGNKSGHVRVYQNISGVWTKVGDDINGEKAEDYSGYSVSLSNDGTIVAIGSPYSDDGCSSCTNSGQVRVYQNIMENPLRIKVGGIFH